MTETRTLLREYVEKGSESAFRALVERYIDLVYSTAVRLVADDSHRAEDVTQMVFVRLSQKAGTLAGEVSLGGWLHRDTCHVAATLMRGERRRQIRERQAVEMNALHDEPEPNLTSVLPILDDAINGLADEDREAIMLRFFEQQSFREVGEIVGSSEDAARMRVNRALEKLQGLLRSRGVATLSVAGLASILGTKAVSAAPVGLAASVTKGIGAGGIGGGASTQAVIRPLAKSLKLALVPGAALVAMLGLGIYVGHRATEKTASKSAQMVTTVAPKSVSASASGPAEEPASAETTNAPSDVMMFHVVDAGSGAPLAAAKVRVAYFPSRDGNVVHLETDAKGVAAIKLPEPPENSANIFLTAAGHAPMTTSLREGQEMPTNYVMKVPAGTMLGGLVVDEEQQPVANVKISFHGPGIDGTKRDNEEFGPDTVRYTDENGRWWSDTVPADFESITLLLTQADFAATVTNLPGNNPEPARTVLVIRKGVLVKGTVVGPNGQPIAGASVKQAQNRMEPTLSAKSDGSGHFELGRWNDRDLSLAVQAEGFSPVVLDATLSNNPAEFDFKLAPGHILRGRVVDESGAAITNARIETEMDMYGVRKIEWSGETDMNGRFEWKSAPGEAVKYGITADGFAGTGESLLADGTEHQITLGRPQASGPSSERVRGTVMDADTGQPLNEFKVLVGDVPIPDSPPRFRFASDGKDGHFDVRIMYVGSAYQIEIQKDGYAPVASTNLMAKDGDQILAFNLHKDAGISGEVLLPNGDPATNATVFLYELQGGVYMDKPGEFRKERNVSTAPRTQADDHGHFSFAPELNARGFIAIDDQGYAEVPISSFNGKIALEPWGRIEGKLSVAGHPGVGKTVIVGQVLYRSYANGRMFAPLSLWLESTTDKDGNFVFEKVPPGERMISLRLTPPNNGPGRLYDAQQKRIMVAPGTVTQVGLGGSGTTVTGRAVFTGGNSQVKWQEVPAELSLKVSNDGPGNPPKLEDYPSTDAFAAAVEAYQKVQREFWSSEQGQALDRSRRSYTAYCTDDGSFSIPDVPAGQYNLRIDIRQRGGIGPNDFDGHEVGTLEKEVNVPDSSAGKDHEVLDVGTLNVPAANGNGG